MTVWRLRRVRRATGPRALRGLAGGGWARRGGRRPTEREVAGGKGEGCLVVVVVVVEGRASLNVLPIAIGRRLCLALTRFCSFAGACARTRHGRKRDVSGARSPKRLQAAISQSEPLEHFYRCRRIFSLPCLLRGFFFLLLSLPHPCDLISHAGRLEAQASRAMVEWTGKRLPPPACDRAGMDGPARRRGRVGTRDERNKTLRAESCRCLGCVPTTGGRTIEPCRCPTSAHNGRKAPPCPHLYAVC